jgi:hypothetical protein
MKQKASLYTVGSRVAHIVDMEEEYGSEGPSEPYYGEVIALTTDDKLVVKWDSDYHQSYHSGPIPLDEVALEKDAKVEYTRLEEEFNEISDALAEKMKKAGKIIVEAAKLAKQNGLELREMYDAYRPLYNAMDQAGWNTSSFNC